MLLFLSNIYTEQERLEAWKNPGNLMVSDEFIEKHKDDILLFLAEEGTAYPTEMARHLSIHVDSVNKILSELYKNDLIKKISPDPYFPDDVFKHKIAELNFPGFEFFKRCSWWIITEDAIAYIKIKYKGEGKQIHKSLVKHYGLGLD